jgi:hypothetical protein
MIYAVPAPGDPLDQGDLIDDCPVLSVVSFDQESLLPTDIKHVPTRVLVLTQTCDLVQVKGLARCLVAVVQAAQQLVDLGILKPNDIKGPIRAGRVYGWYFLPQHVESGLPEMIVDLRQVHTVRLDLLRALCQQGKRRARVQPLYREHLAKHFADTYSRIGLPQPYETL